MITKEEMKTLMNVGTDAEDDDEVERILGKYGIGHVLGCLEEERMANELTELVQIQDRQIMRAIRAIPPNFPYFGDYFPKEGSGGNQRPKTDFINLEVIPKEVQETFKKYKIAYNRLTEAREKIFKPILITQAPYKAKTKRERRLERFFGGEGRLLECKCEYQWVYMGKRKKWATCPSCFRQVKL